MVWIADIECGWFWGLSPMVINVYSFPREPALQVSHTIVGLVQAGFRFKEFIF